PWLIVGLFGAASVSFLMSRFERALSEDLSLAFFLPAIVYMSDAVGTQTETMIVRNMATKRIRFAVYLVKEFFLGLALGVIFGILLGGFAFVWLHDSKVALSVGLAMFANILVAPLIALAIPTFIRHAHKDPALGAGPFTTIIQDAISVVIYFMIATAIIFH
ncbi:MAG TPA: magnesium transporter, partial [Patescibacteria group bacterium]